MAVRGADCRAAMVAAPSRLAVRQGSFDGHLWPWLPINVLRCQMANLHSSAGTGPV